MSSFLCRRPGEHNLLRSLTTGKGHEQGTQTDTTLKLLALVNICHGFGCPALTPISYLGISLPEYASWWETGPASYSGSWRLPNGTFLCPRAATCQYVTWDGLMECSCGRRPPTTLCWPSSLWCLCPEPSSKGGSASVDQMAPSTWLSLAPPAQPPIFQA